MMQQQHVEYVDPFNSVENKSFEFSFRNTAMFWKKEKKGKLFLNALDHRLTFIISMLIYFFITFIVVANSLTDEQQPKKKIATSDTTHLRNK